MQSKLPQSPAAGDPPPARPRVVVLDAPAPKAAPHRPPKPPAPRPLAPPPASTPPRRRSPFALLVEAVKSARPEVSDADAQRAASAALRLLDAPAAAPAPAPEGMSGAELRALAERGGRLRWLRSGLVERLTLDAEGRIVASHVLAPLRPPYRAVAVQEGE